MGRVVLVTGVSMDLGRRFARQLTADPAVERVIGVDVLPPRGDVGSVQFVRADIRNPVIAKVIAREQVDTVVHMGVIASPGMSGGRASMKELNVIGTMQLLAAAQQASTLQHLVVKSSSAFYASSSRDPAMFTEEMTPRRQSSGYAKDVAEVESYVRGFARRRPDVRVTTLRAANVIGPLVNSPITSYFRLPVVPTVLGFDPRLQFLHEHDLLGVVQHATLNPIPGTFNVAGDGMMTLSQAIRRLGKPGVSVPGFAMGRVAQLVKQARLADFVPELVPLLTYGRGLDTIRMRTELGYEPRYTSGEAFADFGTSVPPGALSSSRVESAEQGLLGLLAGGGSRA
ncbi:MAG: NAD-dependent epimerase/dehydratase [Nocardioidaceae bacterium]|nr:NAD-dependent epimerase/dehydratase [Nocardioidaceae bacterium]